MVVNSSGQRAIKWTINPNGKTVRIGDSQKYYVFTPAWHVVMAWVDEIDVPALLAKKEKTCNCNNGTFKNAFTYANLMDVNLHEFGDRHGSLQSNYREVDIEPTN